MKGKKFILALGVCLFISICTSPFVQADEPGKLLMDSIERGLNVLKDPSMKGDSKLQDRRQKLWEEISPIFSFEEMSKRALAQYWNKRSPEEKKEFVELFTSMLKDTYIGKTDTYSGEKVVLLKEKKDVNYAEVQTKFILNTGTEIAADYRMLNNEGKWKIYDVIIEGVSIVNNYRSQFNNILAKSSYKELVQKIKEKNIKEKELSAK